MKKPTVCVLRTAGTNCDVETAFGFSSVGASAERVHINELLGRPQMLQRYHILALPGGFSYGDDIASGRIFASELKHKLASPLRRFLCDGKLVIGICNGFQVLVKAGFLPGSADLSQEATLALNDSGKFEDRWVYLKRHQTPDTRHQCVWTRGLPEVIYLPVAHGEGKFLVNDRAVLERLEKNGQIVLRYCDARGNPAGYPANPNGSLAGIAGICDESGRILGLMPHPERHIEPTQHPRWTGGPSRFADGLMIFENAVSFVRKNL